MNLYTFGRLYKKNYNYKQGFTNAISGTFFLINTVLLRCKIPNSFLKFSNDREILIAVSL